LEQKHIMFFLVTIIDCISFLSLLPYDYNIFALKLYKLALFWAFDFLQQSISLFLYCLIVYY
jgi:hypothetical protein